MFELLRYEYYYKRWQNLSISQIKRLIGYYSVKEYKRRSKLSKKEILLEAHLPFESENSIKIGMLYRILGKKQ